MSRIGHNLPANDSDDSQDVVGTEIEVRPQHLAASIVCNYNK